MNKAFEIAATILICLSSYLLFNLYEELDLLKEKIESIEEQEDSLEKRLESIHDYVFQDYPAR